jgi:sec-independent protein translocase protein TatA
MKSLGRGIVEFKKGVKGVEEEVDSASNKSTQKKIETEKDVTKQENK